MVDLDPVPVVDRVGVYLHDPAEHSVDAAVLPHGAAQLAVGPVKGLLHLESAVTALADIISRHQRILDAEVGGAVTRRHVALHLLLGEVGTLAPHPNGRAQVVKVPTVQLEEFCKETFTINKATLKRIFLRTHEKDPEVGVQRAGVMSMMHLEEGDHHEDEAVGGQPAGEHLHREGNESINVNRVESSTSLRSLCNKNCLST